MDTRTVTLNIHPDAPDAVWTMLDALYRELPRWSGMINGKPQWYGDEDEGDGERLIVATRDEQGLTLFARLPEEPWQLWFGEFCREAEERLGFAVGAREEGQPDGAEPLYENLCIQTTPVLTEFNLKSRPLWFTAFLAFYAVFSVWACYKQYNAANMTQAATMGFLAVASLFMLAIQPRLRAAKMVRAAKKYSGEPAVSRTFFTREGLYFEHADRRIPYGDITMLTTTRHLYLLRLGTRSYVLLDREGFRRGDAAGFVSFLREQAPQAKGSLGEG